MGRCYHTSLSPVCRLPSPGTVEPATPLPPSLPTFTPAGSIPSSSGLSLLASVATGTLKKPRTVDTKGSTTPAIHLYSKGPYNPAALLPTKVAKKILDLEFVEMAEITLDDPPASAPGHPPLPARPPIQNISVWIEKFSILAALIASRFPEKAPELFAYQASIVRAERNFDDRRWVTYDRCFRREALAAKSLDWSVPNLRLYNEAFTGHAKAIPRCTFCLQEDHASQTCPRNPSRPWFGWVREPDGWPQPTTGRSQSAECCRRYNDGKCRQTANTCRYSHKCIDCSGPHPRSHCPRGQRSYNRPRSPGTCHNQAGQNPGPSYQGRLP